MRALNCLARVPAPAPGTHRCHLIIGGELTLIGDLYNPFDLCGQDLLVLDVATQSAHHKAKVLAEDAAMIRGTDRYAWASCYLQDMSKAVIDDVVKVLEAPGSNSA